MESGDRPQCCERAKAGMVAWEVPAPGWVDRPGWHVDRAIVPEPVDYCPYCGAKLPEGDETR